MTAFIIDEHLPGGISESDSWFTALPESHCSRCGTEIDRDEYVLILYSLGSVPPLYYQYCQSCQGAGHA